MKKYLTVNDHYVDYKDYKQLLENIKENINTVPNRKQIPFSNVKRGICFLFGTVLIFSLMFSKSCLQSLQST